MDVEKIIDKGGPAVLMLIGVGMIVVAAVGYLADGVAIAFAVVGAGLLVLGALVRLLEGAFELGVRGVKGQLRVRGDEFVKAVEEVAPEAAEPAREVVRALNPWYGDVSAQDILAYKMAQQKHQDAAATRQAGRHLAELIKQSEREMREALEGDPPNEGT